MGQPRSERGLGIALVVAAAIAWSTAPFFTRVLPFDPWTILFWRGLFAGSLIVVFARPDAGPRCPAATAGARTRRPPRRVIVHARHGLVHPRFADDKGDERGRPDRRPALRRRRVGMAVARRSRDAAHADREPRRPCRCG